MVSCPVALYRPELGSVRRLNGWIQKQRTYLHDIVFFGVVMGPYLLSPPNTPISDTNKCNGPTKVVEHGVKYLAPESVPKDSVF